MDPPMWHNWGGSTGCTWKSQFSGVFQRSGVGGCVRTWQVFTQTLGDNGVVREAFLGNIVPLAKTEKKKVSQEKTG